MRITTPIHSLSVALLLFCSACSNKEEASVPSEKEPTTTLFPQDLSHTDSEELLNTTEQKEATPTALAKSEPKKINLEKLEKVRSEFAIDTDQLRESIVARYELGDTQGINDKIAYLLNRYETGDNSVAIDLALLLAHIGNNPKQTNQAKLILEMAAEDGDPRAYSELARLILLKHNDEFDSYQAIIYLEQAVAARDPEGTYLLGVAHRLNLLPDSNLATGTELLETAAELGHSNAAIALFNNMQRMAYPSEGSEGNYIQTLRILLEDYPDMEGWLNEATKRELPTDYNNLYEFYNAMNEKEQALEALSNAAQLGSFHALAILITRNNRAATDLVYRDSMKELLHLHIDSSSDSAGEANFILASLYAYEKPNEESIKLIKQHLEKGFSNGNYRAGVALLRMQQGANLHQALGDSYKEKNTYKRYLELKRQLEINKQPNHAPYPKNTINPQYPPELLTEGIEGQVIVEMIINKDGKVLSPKVVESTYPGLDSYVIEAVENSEFEPALKDGKPIPTKIRMPFYFKPLK